MILKPELVLCLKRWVHVLPLTLELSLLSQTFCPGQAACTNVTGTAGSQLFVSWASPHKGKPVLRKHLSHWMVQAIALVYLSQGLQPPEGLRARSTSCLATLWALFPAVNLRDVCAVTSSPLSGFIC